MSNMPILPIRLTCTLLTLGQLLFLAAPVKAQGVFIPSPGTGGYYNGMGIGNPLMGYSPLTSGPQYGYSAASTGHMPSQGLGMAVGLGMMGGMVGIGTIMMGSQMMARRNMNKNNPNNPNNKPKDKAATSERRRNQELKLKGQLDSDYQKELAEKGMVPQSAQIPGEPRSFAPPATGGQQFPAGGQSMGQPFSQGSMNPSMNPPLGQPMGQSMGQSQPMGQQAFNGAAAAAPESAAGGVLNPTPWSPSEGPQPSF
jgi:hypothetical protein